MPRWVAFVVAVLVLAGAVWWWSGRNAPERRILRQMDRVMELVEKDPGEGPLASLERARALAELFAAEFEVRARPFDFRTRDRRALIQAIQGYRSSSDRVWAEADGPTVQVDPSGVRAVLDVVARFGGGPSLDRGQGYRFHIGWVDERGEWRIETVDLLEVVP
ncbi:MAG: hypothetical protein R2991_07915 [Thermoanaerobaculia bacterium]